MASATTLFARIGWRTLPLRRRWFVRVILRSLFAALLMVWAGSFHRESILAGGLLFLGSLLTPWARTFVAVRYLLEFELAVNGAFTAACWFAAHCWSNAWPSLAWLPISRDKFSAILVCAAVFVYMIRGGCYLVRGVLKKAGGLPDADAPGFATSEGYTHGKMID